jgi:hypothetical protein
MKRIMDTDALLTEKPFTQFTPKSSWSVMCCYEQHIHISNQLVEASNVMKRKHRILGIINLTENKYLNL